MDIRRSEENLRRQFSRLTTWVLGIRFSGKYLYWMSHLVSPIMLSLEKIEVARTELLENLGGNEDKHLNIVFFGVEVLFQSPGWL